MKNIVSCWISSLQDIHLGISESNLMPKYSFHCYMWWTVAINHCFKLNIERSCKNKYVIWNINKILIFDEINNYLKYTLIKYYVLLKEKDEDG